eukprot:TRINITY_DN5125_c0_g3_i1.p1 TRINITY_DN5125_c0_g3~~TRINITY_DN5125_c0_g3_i1.p1  ORF type:complete len:657 (+),score=78.61 TRINITY_DN5125_c0_g3_i1:122-2092(+)
MPGGCRLSRPSGSGPDEQRLISLSTWVVGRFNEHAFRQKRRISNVLSKLASINLSDFDFNKISFPPPIWVLLQQPGHPDRRKLLNVQDFYGYVEQEGKQFFNQLDKDKDGLVSIDDIRSILRQRNLPEWYADDFIRHARGNRFWSKKVSWEEFKTVGDAREQDMLRAFTSMEVNSKGQIELKDIQNTLQKMGLPTSSEVAGAMLRQIGCDEADYVSYGKFRSFLMLLPKTKIQSEVDASVLWYESATIFPLGPPSERPQVGATLKMMLTAAIAGGLASSSSTFLMHPVDTLKTRVQSIVGATARSVAKSIPQIGAQGLYRGVIPATVGAGASHGLRTCAYEGSQVLLKVIFGPGAELQIQGLSSAVGTLLGTCLRIPCEVLKQRLQVGLHTNVSEAVNTAVTTDGVRGLFKGTTATLSREIPFYVLGMVGYEYLKKVVSGELFNPESPPKQLSIQQTIGVGALSGAIAAILTTPADVLKTRIMTAGVGVNVSAVNILVDILQKEGLLALFKGALPRAIWIAPLGAMNFAGYEIAKNALSKRTEQKSSQLKDNQQQREEQQQVYDTFISEQLAVNESNTEGTTQQNLNYQQINEEPPQSQQKLQQHESSGRVQQEQEEQGLVQEGEGQMGQYEKPLGSLLNGWSGKHIRWQIPIHDL